MDIIKILQVLSNEFRLNILKWLGDPTVHFTELASSVGEKSMHRETGVCVGLIQRKSGLSQSTVSQYMVLMESAGLVLSKKRGKWNYYSRNEKTLSEFKKLFISFLDNINHQNT